MKNLFLIDGASATGKSDLLKWVTENNADDVSFVVKGTTRVQREYERDDPEILLDLNFLTKEEFQDRNYDYAYTYGGGRYGFMRAELTIQLLQRDNVFVMSETARSSIRLLTTTILSTLFLSLFIRIKPN